MTPLPPCQDQPAIDSPSSSSPDSLSKQNPLHPSTSQSNTSQSSSSQSSSSQSSSSQSSSSQSNTSQPPGLLLCGNLPPGALDSMLQRWGLGMATVEPGEEIPGSYWGAPEAGLRWEPATERATLWVRGDTPLHSALHEACHLLCMSEERRLSADTDAGGDDLEECGVCLLQILLADWVEGASSARLCADMDAWGYSFRLGSTLAWVREDSEDARRWLLEQDLVRSNRSEEPASVALQGEPIGPPPRRSLPQELGALAPTFRPRR
ncbi:MAG: hypothetical protein AAGD01_05635 [Acidobacteriota bacterium]